jgi:hypothetical protein
MKVITAIIMDPYFRHCSLVERNLASNIIKPEIQEMPMERT